jgi:ribosomal protein S27E
MPYIPPARPVVPPVGVGSAREELPSTAPESTLPETRERRCPSCQSEQIVYAGRIIGAGGMTKVERLCEACGTAFLFVRDRIH